MSCKHKQTRLTGSKTSKVKIKYQGPFLLVWVNFLWHQTRNGGNKKRMLVPNKGKSA